MIKHIVMFKFKEGTTEDIVIDIKRTIDSLPKTISEIKSMETGIDVKRGPNSYDLILISEFDNLDTLEEYRIHPDHQKLIDMISPYKESTKAVDFEF